MTDPHPVPRLAARRPDWELPELHSDLQLASLDTLYNNKERIKCPKCGRSRAHYCYDCLEALVPFPHVALPFRVSIVTHHEEKASKNTGVQVAILAAGQVDLHTMSNVPSDVDPSRCAVLFPSDNALEVEQLEPDSIDRLFIIDSRWKKAGELIRTETFQAMRALRLRETRSAFWRFHTRGVAEEGVCTVEALYFCLDALAKKGKLTDPRFTAPHAFDNLLWYFVYQHQVVQQAAQKRLQGAPGQAQGQGNEGPSDGVAGPTRADLGSDAQPEQQQANGQARQTRQQQQQQEQRQPKQQKQQGQQQRHKQEREGRPGGETGAVPGGRGAGCEHGAAGCGWEGTSPAGGRLAERAPGAEGAQEEAIRPDAHQEPLPDCTGAAAATGGECGGQGAGSAGGGGGEAAEGGPREGVGEEATAAAAAEAASAGKAAGAEDTAADDAGHRAKRART